MKTRFFVVVLMVAVVGFSSCGNKPEDPKSSDNSIKEFKVDGKKYEIKGTDITYLYPKKDVNDWGDMPKSTIKAEITLTHSKAKVVSGEQLNFSGLGTDGGTVGTVEVKAEDGTPKSYTVKVTKGTF